jgi:hypothetical protein
MEFSEELQEKLRVLHSNTLVNSMMRVNPVWESLLGMLRPMDIVSLARATQFRLKPTQAHCMAWWRQVFYNMNWIDKFPNISIPAHLDDYGFDTCPIMVIGKDLNRLNCAITKWHYFDAKDIRLLVVVYGQVQVGWDDAVRALVASIETSYVWGRNKLQVQVRADLVQTCVLLNGYSFFDLCRSWEKSLLELHLNNGPRSPSFTVWHSKLRMPNFVIDHFTSPVYIVEQLRYSTNDCTVRIELGNSLSRHPHAEAWVPE